MDTAGLWFEGQDNYTNLPKLKYVFGQHLENAFGQDIDLTIEETETGDTVVFVELANRQRYFRVPYLSKAGVQVYERDMSSFRGLEIYSIRPTMDAKNHLLVLSLKDRMDCFFVKHDEKNWRMLKKNFTECMDFCEYTFKEGILARATHYGTDFFRWEDETRTFLELPFSKMDAIKTSDYTNKIGTKGKNPFSVFNEEFYFHSTNNMEVRSKDTLLMHYIWNFNMGFDLAQSEQPFEFLGLRLQPDTSSGIWETVPADNSKSWRLKVSLDSLTAVWVWDNALSKYVCVQITEPANLYSQHLREILTKAPVFGEIRRAYFEKIAIPDYATLLKKYPNFKPNLSNTETPEQALGWKLLKENKLTSH